MTFIVASLVSIVVFNWRQLPCIAVVLALCFRSVTGGVCLLALWVLLRRTEFSQQRKGLQNTAASVWLQYIRGQLRSGVGGCAYNLRHEVIVGAWKTGAGETMENSSDGAAFSIRKGANAVQLDVAATLDRCVVAFDDSPNQKNLQRLTGGAVDQYIADLRFADCPPILTMIRSVTGSWLCTTSLAGSERRIQQFEEVAQALVVLAEEGHQFGVIVNITRDSQPLVEYLSDLIRKYPSLRSRMVVGSFTFPLVNEYWRTLNPDVPTLMTFSECAGTLALDVLGLFPFCELPRNCVFILPWNAGGLEKMGGSRRGATPTSYFEQLLLKCGRIWCRQIIRHLDKRGIPVGFVACIDELDDVVAVHPTFVLVTHPSGAHSYITTPYMRGIQHEQ